MNTEINTNLEKAVIQVVREGLGEAIAARLNAGYHNGPLSQLVDSVIVSRVDAIRQLIEKAVDGAIAGDLGNELKQAIQHKLAKLLVHKFEGEVERRIGDLKSNPEFRAKLTLALIQATENLLPKK